MTQQTQTVLLQGGLNLVSPAVAIPAGQCSSAINYVPDVAGYSRIGGFERFDGSFSPSDMSYWRVNFDAGRITGSGQTLDDLAQGGGVLIGATSGAVGIILAVVLESGSYAGGDAAGYIVFTATVDFLNNDPGGFQDNENLWDTANVYAAVNGAPQELAFSDSDPASHASFLNEAADSRRASILAVGGISIRQGAVRGVWVYRGSVWAFRDSALGTVGGRMHRSTSTSWVTESFGHLLTFNAGSAEFVEGEVITGGTSAATATIERVVTQSGDWGVGNDAVGYLILSNVSGTFQSAETITSATGSATVASIDAVELPSGGRYDFCTHNFYGAAKLPRMYFCNGEHYAYEWDGEVLAQIRTGTTAGALEDVTNVVTRAGDSVTTRAGDFVVLRIRADVPLFISHYKNHLFLGYRSGGLIFSGVGEPLDYRVISGAGEISFGSEMTGLLTSAATALVIYGRTRIEYVTGADSDTFQMQPITDGAGAIPYSVQMIDKPVHMDDGGLRSLGATSAFGDWKLGSLSQAVYPLIKAKRKAGVQVVASLRVRSDDQYWLFWDDGTGLVVYFGRKNPEILPFKLPITVTCACAGELNEGEGDRLFVGAEDGYVYELNRGRSFDGANIEAFIRPSFNNVGSPTYDKRFGKVALDIMSEDPIDLGITFDVDYSRAGSQGAAVDYDVAAGTPIIEADTYGNIDWTEATQGILEAHVDGIGRNLAATVVYDADDRLPHTLSAAHINFSGRRLHR